MKRAALVAGCGVLVTAILFGAALHAEGSGEEVVVLAGTVDDVPENATVLDHTDDRIADNDAIQTLVRDVVENDAGAYSMRRERYDEYLEAFEEVDPVEDERPHSRSIYVRYDGTVVVLSRQILL